MEIDDHHLDEYIVFGLRELRAYLGRHAAYARYCARTGTDPPYIERGRAPRSHKTIGTHSAPPSSDEGALFSFRPRSPQP